MKLSGLLRRLLRHQEHFVTLREELAAIDEYLDIERVRFGPTLVVEKEIDDASLDIIVPSMILQPLVENSIKHGLGRKVGEGRVTIRSTRRAGHAVIEVVDNGIGMSDEQLDPATQHGIGLRNVNERLRVIYGANYELKLHSVAGQGTSARIEIPELVAAGARHRMTAELRSASWSSTTSSSRARSCVSCWDSQAESKSSARPPTACRRCGCAASCSRTCCFSTSRCRA